MSAAAMAKKRTIPAHPNNKLILKQAIGRLPKILDIDSLTKEKLKKFDLATDSLAFIDVLATLIYHDYGIAALRTFIIDNTYSYSSQATSMLPAERTVIDVKISKEAAKIAVCRARRLKVSTEDFN